MRRGPLTAGALYSLLLAGVYSFVIVASTPYLSPWTAMRLSVEANWPLFLALTATFGTMMGLRKWLREQRVCLTNRKQALGASSSALSAFFSLFSLTLVGCCGLLAFWVSVVLGTAVVASLVQLSLPLTLLALGGMMASILLMLRSGFAQKHARTVERGSL